MIDLKKESFQRFFICFYDSRKTVVCPIIDVISDDTFEYMAGSDMTYGGFNWKLNFRWYPVPQREMDRRKGDQTSCENMYNSRGSFFYRQRLVSGNWNI